MFPAIKLHAPNPPKPYLTFSLNRPSSSLPFSSLSFSTADRESPSSLTSSVGTPPSPRLAQWNLNRRHIHLLGFVACTVTFLSPALFFSWIRFLWRICMQILLFHWFLPSLGNGILIFFLLQAAISASWLFFSAIPALLVCVLSELRFQFAEYLTIEWRNDCFSLKSSSIKEQCSRLWCSGCILNFHLFYNVWSEWMFIHAIVHWIISNSNACYWFAQKEGGELYPPIMI